MIRAGSADALIINSHSALDPHTAEDQFMAEINALISRETEEYYRTMLDRDVEGWNLRDEHLDRMPKFIADFLRNKG